MSILINRFLVDTVIVGGLLLLSPFFCSHKTPFDVSDDISFQSGAKKATSSFSFGRDSVSHAAKQPICCLEKMLHILLRIPAKNGDK